MKRTAFSLFLALGLALAHGDEPAAASSSSMDYRIAARDTLQFDVYNQPDMKTVQRVTTSGEIRLPLIGTVSVVGATLREAELLLESLYRSAGYFVAPQVILSVEKYAERAIAVLGQVKEPARIELAAEDNKIGILQAITQAGGFTRVARTDAVQVLRKSPKGEDERLTINVDDIFRANATNTKVQEFQLLPGDVVFVPERAF